MELVMKDNPRAAKVAAFKEKLEQAKVAVITEYKGLSVKEMEEFRRDLRANGAQLRIIKNTLAKLALSECELPTCDDVLVGQIAFVLGFDDAVSAPKVAAAFSRKKDEFKILAGVYEGRFVGPEIINRLATLPNKEILKAQLLMLLMGPQIKFLSLMKAVQQELAGTLKALAEKKAESSPES